MEKNNLLNARREMRSQADKQKEEMMKAFERMQNKGKIDVRTIIHNYIYYSRKNLVSWEWIQTLYSTNHRLPRGISIINLEMPITATAKLLKATLTNSSIILPQLIRVSQITLRPIESA
jgi:hypothetical protein